MKDDRTPVTDAEVAAIHAIIESSRVLVLAADSEEDADLAALISEHLGRIDDLGRACAAAVGVPTTTVCESCRRPPDAVNHVPGHVFVGFGIGWQPCPVCKGSTVKPAPASASGAAELRSGDIEDIFTLTLATQKREIELLRAVLRSAGDSVDSFGIDDPGTTAGRALDAIDLALGRPMSAARVWNAHLRTCQDCMYDRDCTACVADGEHESSAHACNCPKNGTGARLRAAAEAEAEKGIK